MLTLADFALESENRLLWGDGPLLVVRPVSASTPDPRDESSFAFDTPSRSTLVSSGSSDRIDPGTIGDYLLSTSLVIPVRKTSGNPFPLIHVGRARNNDVCIDDRSVSKVHAYFIEPSAASAMWGLKDAKSLNGTTIMTSAGPLRLGADTINVEHGAEIRFGLVRCIFSDRETLADAVKWASKTWK